MAAGIPGSGFAVTEGRPPWAERIPAKNVLAARTAHALTRANATAENRTSK